MASRCKWPDKQRRARRRSEREAERGFDGRLACLGRDQSHLRSSLEAPEPESSQVRIRPKSGEEELSTDTEKCVTISRALKVRA